MLRGRTATRKHKRTRRYFRYFLIVQCFYGAFLLLQQTSASPARPELRMRAMFKHLRMRKAKLPGALVRMRGMAQGYEL